MADEVSDMAVAPDQTARLLWDKTCSLFTANRDTRAIYLRTQFHTLVQGDLLVTDYFQRLKTLADALRDVGRPINDDDLVLNALRGLSPRFKTAANIIAFTDPLPSFAKPRDLLLASELSEPTAADVSATALVTMTSPTCTGSACGSSSTRTSADAGAPSTGAGRGRGRVRGKGKGPAKNGGGGFYSNSGRQPVPTGPWVCFNPLGQFPSASPGILGPRPAPAPGLYHDDGASASLLQHLGATVGPGFTRRSAQRPPVRLGHGLRCLQPYGFG